MLLSRVPSAVLVLLALPIAASSCTAAPVAPASGSEVRAALEREVPRLLREGDIPGISIAVIRDKKIAWSGAFGVADPASGAPVRPDTVFQAASLTKPVFAYMVLRLADRGVIDLDQPLWQIVPEPRLEKEPRARRMTARHVLSHTTGLPNWGGDTLEASFAPGERFQYSGEGFVWLQKAVEKLTGTPAAELLRREVLAPLGMTRSSLLWEESFAGSVTAGVDELGNTRPTPRPTQANAASSLLTTAEDYGRFLVALLEGTGLRPETRAAMLTPAVQVSSRFSDPASPPHQNLAWGLGWGLQGPGGREAFWHWGHNVAWRAYVFVQSDGSAGLVYFTNSHEGLNIARALAALAMDGAQGGLDWLEYESYDDPRHLARKDIGRALRTSPQAGARRWRELRSTQAADEELALEMAQDLIQGKRGAEAVALLEAVAAEDPRSAKLQDRLGIAYLAAGDLEAARRCLEKALKLDPETPSRQAEIRWIDEGLEARKTPVALAESELRRFTGDYGPCHVLLENGRLVYVCDGLPPWLLVPLSSDTFVPEGVGDVRIRFATDPGGRAMKLTGFGPNRVEWERSRD